MGKKNKMFITVKQMCKIIFRDEKALAKIIYEEGEPFKLLVRKRLLTIEEWREINELVNQMIKKPDPLNTENRIAVIKRR